MLSLSGIVSRAFGKRCPLAFMEHIYPHTRAHPALRSRARDHHDFGPTLRPEPSQVEPESPERCHSRSKDQLKETRQGEQADQKEDQKFCVRESFGHTNSSSAPVDTPENARPTVSYRCHHFPDEAQPLDTVPV